MSLGAALDVAIGLIFTYLLLALLASAVRESFAGFFDLRAKGLRNALAHLLSAADAAGNPDPSVFQSVFGHSLVYGILPKKQDPSYVPAQSFTLALLERLKDGSQAPLFTQIERGVAGIPGGPVKQTLQTFVTQAAGDMEKLKTQIATWFDDAMDRVSGVYKRHSQAWMFVIGLAVAVLLNVDSINIAATLWNDPAKRDIVVAAAQKYAASEEAKAAVAQAGAKSDEQQAADAEKAAKQLAEVANNQLAALPLPIGWDDMLRKIQCPDAKTPAECKPPPLPSWCARLKLIATAFWQAMTAWTLVGWLITALAVSFGAPFWFDALGDVLKLRAAGPKPPRADDPANPQNAAT